MLGRQTKFATLLTCCFANSQKSVPSSEEVMLDQVFVNDELAYIRKERELFREYEGMYRKQVQRFKLHIHF